MQCGQGYQPGIVAKVHKQVNITGRVILVTRGAAKHPDISCTMTSGSSKHCNTMLCEQLGMTITRTAGIGTVIGFKVSDQSMSCRVN